MKKGKVSAVCARRETKTAGGQQNRDDWQTHPWTHPDTQDHPELDNFRVIMLPQEQNCNPLNGDPPQQNYHRLQGSYRDVAFAYRALNHFKCLGQYCGLYVNSMCLTQLCYDSHVC